MPISQFPTKKELMESFGYLSFQCAFLNLDLIGIRLRKSYEIVIITYRGAKKTGFMYEGGKLTKEDIDEVYGDVPEDYNELETTYERNFGHLVEILKPRKDMYVWINENEISKIVKTKK